MKNTWKESTFYTDLQKLLDKHEGRIYGAEFDEEYRKLVAQELPNDKWLQGHFNSTAEYIHTTAEEGEKFGVNAEEFERMVETAKFEMKVMRSCGDWQSRQADNMQEWLDEALEMIKI